ncbi:12600_t:CDS:2, partial [Funneliformis mosseae]
MGCMRSFIIFVKAASETYSGSSKIIGVSLNLAKSLKFRANSPSSKQFIKKRIVTIHFSNNVTIPRKNSRFLQSIFTLTIKSKGQTVNPVASEVLYYYQVDESAKEIDSPKEPKVLND